MEVAEQSLLEENAREGESPVAASAERLHTEVFVESRFLGVKR